MKLRLGLVLLAAALVFSAVVAVSSPAAAQQAVALEDVSVRDHLIAQQESLLNTYRCRFDIDTQIVPGGCTDGKPSKDPAEPDPFEGIPTQGELAVRDHLIAQQESLLNTYRCRFDIDTQIVPGGCTDGKPAATGQSDQTPSGPYTAVTAGSKHACALRTDQTVVCWGNDDYRQTDAPDGLFTALTAGEEHVCALRADQTVACWGDNRYRQANAPAGQFDAVSAGAWQTCGLRTDATITCWGLNSGRLTMAPDGQFTAVSAGSAFVCALRTDATITCWGNNGNGQTDAPSGRFTAIAAGTWHACGLRTDARIICWGSDYSYRTDAPAWLFNGVEVGKRHSCGIGIDQTITCWGDNRGGQVSEPEGQFTALSAQDGYSCGLRTDQTIACWGEEPSRQTDAPFGQFTAAAAGSWLTCGLHTDATITCTGNNYNNQTSAPQGQFTAIAAGNWHICALSTDQTITCWGSNGWGQTDAPEGQFTAVAAGSRHSCALSTDQTITCWGRNDYGQSEPPEGQFTAIAAGNWHTCALSTDQTVTCWGSNNWGQTDPPEGQFTAIAAGAWHSCALSTTAVVACWGYNGLGQTDVPFMQFTGVSVGQQHSCGLRIDQTIACWGHGGRLAESPEGPFSAVAAGYQHSCGLRTDQTIACWDLTPIVPAPSGIRHTIRANQPAPELCRQQGVTSGTTAGFPLPFWAPAATGTVRVGVLFLDFPDAVATYTTHEEAELGLPYAEKYLESVSYGQLDIEFVPLHKWLRAEKNHTDYLEESTSFARGRLAGIDQAAASLADPEFDFTSIDVVLVVMPSSHFFRADAGGGVDTEEGPISPVSRINLSPISNGTRKPRPWGDAAAHELGHNLGLADLYAYDDSHEQPDPPVGQAWANLSFGLMGLKAFFLTNPRDPRLAYVWHFPSGHTQTDHYFFPEANEMLAWSRWQLGWLGTSQVLCVAQQGATVSLNPISTEPGDAIAMAAIPLTGTRVIVIESRRKTGYDSGRFHRTSDGVSTTFPALSVEGVLVYTVNSALGTGRLPIKVFGDTGNGQVDEYPILTQGQSVTIDGYTITVQSSTPTADTVIITKTGAP